MSESLSLEQLSDFVRKDIARIHDVRAEVEEIQIGFNSAYVERKAEHDATLARLSEAVTARLAEIGPPLQTFVQERLVVEKRVNADRRQELRETLIPQTQAEADETVFNGQSLAVELHELNPQLDAREEKLKAQRAILEEQLAQLNARIGELSGVLGVVIHLRKINKLDRERNRVIGKLEAIQQDLKNVREEWNTTQRDIGVEQERLQQRWQALTLQLAELSSELDYLDDESRSDNMAYQRSVRHVLDGLNEPLPCSILDIKKELDAMVELNIRTDDFQAGLGSVSGLMSVLDGIAAGMARLNSSIEGLVSEQKMHSSYLPLLHVSVPDEVLAFDRRWDRLRQEVQDDHRLCASPAEFVAAVRPVMENDLSEANIRSVFEAMGRSLTLATQSWNA